MSKIVERTLDLLELFGDEKRPLTLSDIARLLKIPVSSCHDVLQAMQGRGYLYEIAPRAGYYPTLRLQALGKVIADNDPVVARADLLLRSLRDTLDETVLLAKVNGLSATYLLAFEATHPLRFMISVGENVRSLHATSAGKALLGSLEERDLSAFLKTAKLTAFTDRTITTAAALRANLDLSRQRGWFLNHGESLQGVTTLSARFRWNTAVYVVTVAGPALRIDARLDQAAGLLTNVCQLLEMRQHDPAGERR
ncbi:MAG: IclR family transcriptional regulator [Rhodopila sp.]|jgi:DNA-binding IclR family transcriptional regulator